MGQRIQETPEFVLHIREAAEFTVTGKIGHCRFVSGDHLYEIAFDLETMLRSMGNASRAYVEHLATRTVAQVIPFKGRRARH